MEDFTEDAFELHELPQSFKDGRKKVAEFLAGFDLMYDTMDSYVGLFSGEKMIAGGGYRGTTIKCVAIDPNYQSSGLLNKIISYLCSELWAKGAANIFVFTKPSNLNSFRGAGFYLIGSAPDAILLESKKDGIERYVQALKPCRQSGVQGAIVMNANPFTLGHQYLVEYAAKYCDHLHIFVVEEDLSDFPFKVRKRLIEEGTRNFKNVSVHSGGSYIISANTFPSYFIKELSRIAKAYAQLDLDIFAKHIAPALFITKRFVGTEPADALTSAYHQIMQQELPKSGVAAIMLERKEKCGQAISASNVRALLAKGDLEGARSLLPATTADFFATLEGITIIEKLQQNTQ